MAPLACTDPIAAQRAEHPGLQARRDALPSGGAAGKTHR